MNLKINNGLCELFCDDELILKFTKGSLAKRIYNNLNDKTLRIEDEYGFIQPGYYRGTDAGSGRTRIWPIPDTEYLKKVRKNPTMRLLLTIFNPSAACLKLMYRQIQYTIQANEPLNDNSLMYYEAAYVANELVERRYDYGDGEDIQIADLPSLIGYDLQFLTDYRVCSYCKKLYKPQKQEPYCCNTCRCELSRHRSPWCDAQIAVKKQIDQEIEMIQDQIYEDGLQTAEKELLKHTLDIYNAAYNDWLDFSSGGPQSDAARAYQLEGKQCSYTAYLQNWWAYLCRIQKVEI